MAEVAAVPANGYVVASTFSGCGGSSLGYKMAGFRVAWASEFVPAARETYAANFPDTVLDARDIREVRPEEILAAIGMKAGELDVLDGSPPCASFSTAGKRDAYWGKVKKYSDVEQRTDDLFFEFARILQGLQPRAFVAENVSGLVRGVARGYFKRICEALAACGYRVRARLLDAQWLGVPQVRRRVIFVGARCDLEVEPAHPDPLPYQYGLRDALDGVVGMSAKKHGYFSGGFRDGRRRAPTVPAHSSRSAFNDHQVEVGPDLSQYAIGAEYARLRPGEQSSKYFSLVRPDDAEPCPTVTATGGIRGAAGVVHPSDARKFSIAELRRICGFPVDFVLTGTYQQQWERLGRAVPPPMMMRIAEAVRDRMLRATDAPGRKNRRRRA